MTENINRPTQESVAKSVVDEYRKELKRVKDLYESQGWQVDFGPLEKLSSIRQKNSVLLVNGGVNLSAPCDCRAEVDLSGEFFPSYCSDHPNGPPSVETAGKKEKIVRPPSKASVCGEHPWHKMVKDPGTGGWTCPDYAGK